MNPILVSGGGGGVRTDILVETVNEDDETVNEIKISVDEEDTISEHASMASLIAGDDDSSVSTEASDASADDDLSVHASMASLLAGDASSVSSEDDASSVTTKDSSTDDIPDLMKPKGNVSHGSKFSESIGSPAEQKQGSILSTDQTVRITNMKFLDGAKKDESKTTDSESPTAEPMDKDPPGKRIAEPKRTRTKKEIRRAKRRPKTHGSKSKDVKGNKADTDRPKSDYQQYDDDEDDMHDAVNLSIDPDYVLEEVYGNMVFMDAYEEIDDTDITCEMEFLDSYEYEDNKRPPEGTFIDAVQHEDDFDDDLFLQPSQDMSPANRLGRAFHLSADKNTFIREGQVYDLLEELDDRELLGYNEPFDSLAFTFDSIQNDLRGYSMRTLPTMADAEKIQPYLGYRPLNVIRQTLANTTQLASQFVTNTYAPTRKVIISVFE